MSVLSVGNPEVGRNDSETIQNLMDNVIRLRRELEHTLQHLDKENAPALVEYFAEEMSFKVGKGSIIAEINLSEEGVVIAADKIDMEGIVTFESLETAGETVINGSNITTGKIDAVDIEGINIRGSKFISSLSDTSERLEVKAAQTVMNWYNSSNALVSSIDGVFAGSVGMQLWNRIGDLQILGDEDIIIDALGNGYLSGGPWYYNGQELGQTVAAGDGLSLVSNTMAIDRGTVVAKSGTSARLEILTSASGISILEKDAYGQGTGNSIYLAWQ